MRRCWLVACLTALALVASGCIGASHVTSPSSRFGAEAVAWREARYAAGHACIANLTRFLDEHVVVDDRVGGRVVQDRRTYLEACGLFAASHGTGNSDPAEPMALLVSADQILDQFHYPAHVSWTPDVDHWVTVGTVGPRGYTQVMTSASIEHWRTQVPTLQGLDRLEELADRYVALWNGGEGVDAAEVYDMRASVEDTLRGFSAQGLVELRAAVGSGRWPDLPQMEISVLTGDLADGSTPSQPPHVRAIYVGPAVPDTSESDQMVLLLQVDDGSGCRGVVGAGMAVDKGRITWERRYHEVELVRRCFDTSTLKPGWWEGIDIPEPVVHELTGTVTWAEPSRLVEVYNGTPETDEYVRWGLQQFADAGLVPPEVDSVTFVLDQDTCPLTRPGFARYDGPGADVSLCFQPDDVCDGADCSSWTTTASRTLLHEYSHAWMARNVTSSTQRAFMRSVGVSRWQDLDDDWGQRGVEQAANTMMLGLMDEPLAMEPAVCAAFTARFRLLTEVDPPAPCSP
jgi:hypothetical protein